MTIAEAESLVMTRISGGRPSTEVDAHRASVRKYLSAACAELFAAEIRQRVNRDRRGLRGRRVLADPEFYSDRVFDVVRGGPGIYPYVPLTPAPMGVDHLTWLDGVYPELDGPIPAGADSAFRLVQSQAHLRSTDAGMMGNQAFVFYSRNEIRFIGLPGGVTKVRVRYAASPDGLDDADLLPVPSNLYGAVIDRTVEFFANERLTPAERREDGRDEAKTGTQ